MRIITGEYKGRHFEIPKTFKARPTTDFAKENIFNVLNGLIDLNGTSALDLFSGTGGISLELLSRGCGAVLSIEADKEHHSFIRKCLKKLGTDRCVPIRIDAFRFIRGCHQQFDFVFADPPYTLPELESVPTLIFKHRLLKPGGVFVFEHGKRNDFSNLPFFIERRTYGSVNFSIFRAEKTPSEEMEA